jgi:hypothetical protein
LLQLTFLTLSNNKHCQPLRMFRYSQPNKK